MFFPNVGFGLSQANRKFFPANGRQFSPPPYVSFSTSPGWVVEDLPWGGGAFFSWTQAERKFPFKRKVAHGANGLDLRQIHFHVPQPVPCSVRSPHPGCPMEVVQFSFISFLQDEVCRLSDRGRDTAFCTTGPAILLFFSVRTAFLGSFPFIKSLFF